MSIPINRCVACGSTDSTKCRSPDACTPDDFRFNIGDRLQVQKLDATGQNLLWVDAMRCDGCRELTPSATNLDGDDLCWKCANAWVRGEGIAAMERERDGL